MMDKRSTLLNVALAAGLITLAVYVMIVGKAILLPLVVAVFVWYLVNALSDVLGRVTIFGWHPPRIVTFTVGFVALLAGLGGLVELVARNIGDVAAAIPAYEQQLTVEAQEVLTKVGVSALPSFAELGSVLGAAAGVVGSLAAALVSTTGFAVTVLLYMAFLLAEQSHLDRKLSILIANPEREAVTRRALHRIGTTIQRYLWLKTLVGLLFAVISYVVMAAFGLDFAIFWAVLIFFLNYIPYVGSVIGIVCPAVVALLQFPTPLPLLVIVGSMVLLHFVVGNVLEPRLMGKHLNLSPLIILLSLVFWGTIWGIAGMILSIPIMVAVMVILSQFPQTRPLAVILSEDGEVTSLAPASTEASMMTGTPALEAV